MKDIFFQIIDLYKNFLNTYLSLFISILALLFAVISFWWMNWRKGKIVVCKPPNYAAFGSKDQPLVIRLPLVFSNTGPTSIIIRNLCLSINENPKAPLFFTAVLQGILKNEGRDLATPFVLQAKEARLIICEFQRRPGNLIFENKKYPIEIKALIGNKQQWKIILKTYLTVSQNDLTTINEKFIGHDNLLE